MEDAMSDRVVYRERTPFPWWARLIMWGSMVGVALSIVFGSEAFESLLGRLLAVACVLGVGVFVEWLIGGLTVEVRPNELFFGIGDAVVFHKRVAYEDIERLEAVRYHPLREFGGWGVRGSGNRRAWTARGDQAVVLHLGGGRQIYVGSDHPQRLAERIRTVAGDRLGRAGSGRA
jgi:hypothetical protein